VGGLGTQHLALSLTSTLPAAVIIISLRSQPKMAQAFEQEKENRNAGPRVAS
jgi:hypothetical protein